MTEESKEAGDLISEWLMHLRNAQRQGTLAPPEKIADVLTYGSIEAAVQRRAKRGDAQQ